MSRPAERPRKRGSPRSLPVVGLVVEGDTEYEALPLLHKMKLVPCCPPLKASNIRGLGANMSPRAIAQAVCQQVVAHIVAGRSRVLVCLDREDRDDCPGDLAKAIEKELEAELRNTSIGQKKRPHEVSVVIANRAFEAWILADAGGLHARQIFRRAPSFHCFEGQMGKRRQMGVVEIRELWEREYRKTTDGPRLFEKLRFSDARKCGKGQRGSKSLDKLLRCLGV